MVSDESIEGVSHSILIEVLAHDKKQKRSNVFQGSPLIQRFQGDNLDIAADGTICCDFTLSIGFSRHWSYISAGNLFKVKLEMTTLLQT
jgi:hypothetical protein